MWKNVLLWITAFFITVSIAVYQRLTGPTYPISDKIELNGQTIKYKLDRSSEDINDHWFEIDVKDENLAGKIFWRRYKYEKSWHEIEMSNESGILKGYLPAQPKAGKLEYFVELNSGEKSIVIPENKFVVIRFKGGVPTWLLIPHVIAMFGAMFLSMRTGLEIFVKNSRPFKLTYWTIGFLLIGGFLLGPWVQLYAFDAWWTGWPFGTDLTDNKTLIALIGWLLALIMMKKSPNPKKWAFVASIVLIIVYLIPHSVMGSEFDYSKVEKNKIQAEKLSN